MIMKRILLAGNILLAICFAGVPKSQAGVHIGIGIGFPAPVYYYPGYWWGPGWYPAGYYWGPRGYVFYRRPYWRHRFWWRGHWYYR